MSYEIETPIKQVSGIEYDLIYYGSSRTNDDACVHMFEQPEHAICGSTNHGIHPECGPDWPWVSVIPGQEQLSCPGCGRPLCTFCEFLMRQRIGC